jgi:hypothetical protein
MIFNVQIVNHAVPAISVVVADNSASGGVTYQELKNSLGNQVYEVGCLYLYSDNDRQLTGAINYNRFDVNGNKDVTNIITAVDPYQFSGSLLVPLRGKTSTPIIFNGNSSVSATILPNTFLQAKFLVDRITNKLGLIDSNFTQMQDITNSDFFDPTYGEAGSICGGGRDNLITGAQLLKTDVIQNVPSVGKGVPTNILNPPKSEVSTIQQPTTKPIKEVDYTYLLLIAATSAGIYMFSKD